MGPASHLSGPARSARPPPSFTTVQPRAGVRSRPGGTYLGDATAGEPHTFRGRDPAGWRRGRRRPEPRSGGYAREQAAPPAPSARWPGQLGILPRGPGSERRCGKPEWGRLPAWQPGKIRGWPPGISKRPGQGGPSFPPGFGPPTWRSDPRPVGLVPASVFSPQSAQTTAR